MGSTGAGGLDAGGRMKIRWWCLHRNTSRVFTDAETLEKYVMCLGCARRLNYDWDAMCIRGVSRQEARQRAAGPVGSMVPPEAG